MEALIGELEQCDKRLPIYLLVNGETYNIDPVIMKLGSQSTPETGRIGYFIFAMENETEE